MRRSLLVLFVLCLAMSAAVAQKRIELGLNVGLLHSRGEQLNTNSVARSFSVGYNFRAKWQAGISLNRTEYSSGYWSSPPDCIFSGGDYYDYILPTWEVMAERATSAKVFLNRRSDYGKFTFYYGISGGPVTTYNQWLSQRESFQSTIKGYAVGAQAGVTWYFSKRFGINADVAAERLQINRHEFYINPARQISSIAVPATIGFRFRI